MHFGFKKPILHVMESHDSPVREIRGVVDWRFAHVFFGILREVVSELISLNIHSSPITYMEDEDDDDDGMDIQHVHKTNISGPTISELNDSNFVTDQSQDSLYNPMRCVPSYNSLPTMQLFERSECLMIVNVCFCCRHNKIHIQRS